MLCVHRPFKVSEELVWYNIPATVCHCPLDRGCLGVTDVWNSPAPLFPAAMTCEKVIF